MSTVATYTNTSFGYVGVGGVDATTITTKTIKVRAFILVPEADDDFVTLTDATGNSIITFLGPNADEPIIVDWYGKRVEGLIATLDDDASVLIVLTD